MFYKSNNSLIEKRLADKSVITKIVGCSPTDVFSECKCFLYFTWMYLMTVSNILHWVVLIICHQATTVRSSCGSSCWSCWQTRMQETVSPGWARRASSNSTSQSLWRRNGASARTSPLWTMRNSAEPSGLFLLFLLLNMYSRWLLLYLH